MAPYSFLTTWCIDAPLERVWDVLADPLGYPEWWKGVREVTVLEPGEDGDHGVGTLYRMQWRSKLRYSLVFDSRVTRRAPGRPGTRREARRAARRAQLRA